MITYSKTQDFTERQLYNLFSSVGWESAKYADKLVTAMKNSSQVVSAWHEDELVGLMTAMSDGILTVYFHYLLVKPQYQKQQIGKQIVKRMLATYAEYYRKVLVSYKEQLGFYQNCGFLLNEKAVPVHITSEV